MKKSNWFVYTLGFLACFLVRLIPFRAPNIEPILSAQMPFSRSYGALAGFFFGFASIVLFDLATNHVGVWTLVTAFAYGFLGVGATLYFKNKGNSAKTYVSFAIVATIFYDAVTGLTVGPLFFHQPVTVALAGQIPFTILHLVGNISFAYFISPALYRMIEYYQKPKPVESASLITNNPLTNLS